MVCYWPESASRQTLQYVGRAWEVATQLCLPDNKSWASDAICWNIRKTHYCYENGCAYPSTRLKTFHIFTVAYTELKIKIPKSQLLAKGIFNSFAIFKSFFTNFIFGECILLIIRMPNLTGIICLNLKCTDYTIINLWGTGTYFVV